MKKKQNRLQLCDATGLPILCMKCLGIPTPSKSKKPVCDYHMAFEDHRRLDKLDHDNSFNVSRFIEKIAWDKVATSCQPELASLFKNFKKTNEELSRRVI